MTFDAVARIVDETWVGAHVTSQNLVMYPLLPRDAGDPPGLDYCTLDEGLALGWIDTAETSPKGRAGELRVVNRGPKPVLMVEGEALRGSRENRIVNLSVLLPAESDITVPVSAAESVRWRAISVRRRAMPRLRRARRMAAVGRAIAGGGAPTSDQASMWPEIAEKSMRMQSRAASAAMEQLFVEHAPMLDQYVRDCRPVDHQVGAVFAIDERIAGVDLFDSAATFRALLPKLVRSYAIEAIDFALGVQVEPPVLPGRQLVGGYLAAVAAAPGRRVKAVGLGHDVRLARDGLVASGLVVEERIVHLSGFLT
jgi:hypothetical protein